MRELLSKIFTLTPYTDPVERRRAVGTYLITAVMLAGFVLGIAVSVSQLSGGTLSPLGLIRSILLGGAAIAAVLLTRRKQQTFGAIVIVTTWFAVLFLVVFTREVDVAIGFGGMLVGISLATLLIGEQTILYVVGLSAVFLVLSPAANPDSPASSSMTIFLVEFPLLIAHAVINYALAQSMRKIIRQIAADVEERGLRLAGASGALAQRLLAARLDLGMLLSSTVKLVKETFPDVAEAQLYLVDKDRKNASLVATTYPADKSPLGQQVGVGSLNVIGRVTIGGQTVVVRDVGEEQAYRRIAFLEGTRAELVIPLRIGNDTIGALDLQSENVNAFTAEDVEALETLTNQIAVAIDNARLYADAQAKLNENQRLYEQTAASLREIERLNQQLTGGAWAEYLRGMTTIPAYTIDPGTGRVEDAAEWTSTLAEASRRNQTILRGSQQSRTVALPISVRGQVIGAMEFELAPDQIVGQEQMVILQQVVERLGLAAENIRLLDEAQRIAQREAMVNEITARMQAATSVEAVVAAATQSLADSFQANRVAIRLGAPPSKNGTIPERGQ